MKARIHPNYVASTVQCACGNIWQTQATKPEIRVEVCSRCHPAYTGEARTAATTGRVERFRLRYAGRLEAK